jgi:hypothetical protein
LYHEKKLALFKFIFAWEYFNGRKSATDVTNEDNKKLSKVLNFGMIFQKLFMNMLFKVVLK